MSKKRLMSLPLPDYTKGEEIFNFVSHVVGGVFAIAALVLGIIMAAIKGNAWGVVSVSIYGTTMIILYTMSSLYHGLTHPKAKRVFRIIDHCSIFLLIAGTYTPMTLVLLRPEYPLLAWSVFGVIWFFCILGITLNAINLEKFAKFSMFCYLAMGWCIVFAIKPMINTLAKNGLILLVAGGIAYTIGAILYGVGKKKVRYMHGVFHIFVIIGSILHFFCILFYVLPIK